MVPAIKGSESLDFAGFHSYYEELIAKTRENKLTADDFQGTNISLTNPGGIGTVASVPRLLGGQSAIIATGSIAYPPEWLHASPERLKQLGVSKVMTLTSTYDHRVIQGAESGAFLRRVEQLLQGEDGFYEALAADLGIDAGPDHLGPPRLRLGAAAERRRPQRRADRPPPARSTRSCCRRSRRRPRSSRPTAPTATSRPTSTRSAPSPKATRRCSRRTST